MASRLRFRLRAGGAGDAPSFTPNSLLPAVWFDASDLATITDNGAGQVSPWNDKSANAFHNTQATAGFRPITGTRTINGLNTLDFDVTDDTMSFAPISPAAGMSLFVVGMVDALTVNHSFIAGAANGAFQVRINATTGTVSILRQGQASLLTSVAAVTAGVPFIILATSSAAGNAIYINGGAGSSNAVNPAYTTTSSVTGVLLDGPLAEKVLFQRVLSQADANLLGNYEEAKWGIPWSDV